MKCDITGQIDEIAVKLGAEASESDNIVEALEKVKGAISSSGGDSESEPSGGLTNLVDAENDGSVRSILSAEEDGTYSVGYGSMALGDFTEADGDYSFSFGIGSKSSGKLSQAFGDYTIANHLCQHVFGANNIPDDSTAPSIYAGKYIEIVGNGDSSAAQDRSNARTLDWNGNEKLAGSLTLGMGTNNEVTITAAQLQALLALLN